MDVKETIMENTAIEAAEFAETLEESCTTETAAALPPPKKKSKGLGALLKSLFEEETADQELISLSPREPSREGRKSRFIWISLYG